MLFMHRDIPKKNGFLVFNFFLGQGNLVCFRVMLGLQRFLHNAKESNVAMKRCIDVVRFDSYHDLVACSLLFSIFP